MIVFDLHVLYFSDNYINIYIFFLPQLALSILVYMYKLYIISYFLQTNSFYIIVIPDYLIEFFHIVYASSSYLYPFIQLYVAFLLVSLSILFTLSYKCCLLLFEIFSKSYVLQNTNIPSFPLSNIIKYNRDESINPFFTPLFI